MNRRLLLGSFPLIVSAAASAGPVALRFDPVPGETFRFVRVSPDGEGVREARASAAESPDFDFCLKDPENGAVLRFNATTGAYVVCGTDGFFEQGFGTVTTQNGATTLSHSFGSRALQGLESVHATVNATTGQGTATVNARDESHGTFARISISASNVGASDCGSCAAQTAINEGFLNAFPIPSSTIGIGNSVTDVTILQRFAFNSDFDGDITRFVAGIGRLGAGSLSFQFAAYTDENGLPGQRFYLGPAHSYSDYPALPAIGIVDEKVRFAGRDYIWAGIRWDPSKYPLYLPYGINPDSPAARLAFCEPGHACNLVTDIPDFDNARSLYFSADFHREWLASGGVVPYGLQPQDILSEKCDGAYIRLDLVGTTLEQLYSESGPGDSFAPAEYKTAFARITPVASGQIRGLDGVAETRYDGKRFSAISFTLGPDLLYCTRPSDATDYACHDVSGFAGGNGSFTRITGVQAGYEISFGNATQDRIERWMITHGPTAWQTQSLNPLLGQVGNPEFGFPLFAAASSKLGVAYEYQTPTGAVELQLADGNLFYGPFPIGTDIPPAGFDPNLATRMAGDCTRSGLCVFGRYQAVSGKNLADMVDFRGSIADPEIRTWQLGAGSPGLRFGRALSVQGREDTALSASYTPSPTPNQFRLQLDGIDLAKYTKFTIADDFAAGTGNLPLSLARADGEWGLAHAKGIGLLYDAEEGCRAARVRGHSSGATPGPGTALPCLNIPIVQKF